MRLKTLLAVLLALVVGSCSCMVPLAAAASQEDHSCCPSQDAPTAEPDCCLRAAPAAAISLFVPRFQAVGVVDASPALVSGGDEACRLDSASLSPPGDPPVLGRSCRAPPVSVSC